MSSVSSVLTSSSTVASATETALAKSNVSTDQFLQLLVAQLQNQDPLNPMSNEDFLTQLAQFQSLENGLEIAQNTESLLLGQSLSAASTLIGKNVTALQDGTAVSGVVDKVVVVDGDVMLVVGGNQITLDQITEVDADI